MTDGKEYPRVIPPHGGYRELMSYQMVLPKDHPKAQKVRAFCYRKDRTYKTYIEEEAAEISANTVICVIHQTNYLLNRQLRSLEKEFITEGGFTENLYRVRSEYRKGENSPELLPG